MYGQENARQQKKTYLLPSSSPNLLNMRITLIAFSLLIFSSQCSQTELISEPVQPEPEQLIPQQRFYRTGELLANYTMTADSLMHGLYEEYFLDGTVHRRIRYKNGRISGTYESFHPSGTLSSKYTYAQGYAHGPYFWYHKNGKLAQRGEKVWDKAEGRVELFYPNGQLEARRTYQNEQLQGSDITFYPDGKLQSYSYYDQDADRILAISYKKDGGALHYVGNPFADLSAEFDRLSGKFLLKFNLATPPDTQPIIRLIRRQGKNAWLCPIVNDHEKYRFQEPLPDDFAGKYLLEAIIPVAADSLRFSEEIFVQRNMVSYGAPI